MTPQLGGTGISVAALADGAYADAVYSDAAVAALYDVLNPWDASSDFYLELVLAAAAVLDVGCGTGQILHRARAAGHQGRLCGVDPDLAMLGVAVDRDPDSIEWQAGAAVSMTWDSQFDLAIMTGHAFQCLVSDADVSDSLAAIRRALRPRGRFAFDTRNPAAAAWQSWHPANAVETVDPAGLPVRISHQVESVGDGVVALTETTADRDGTALRVDRASLRFLTEAELARFLAEAGFVVQAQYGDWNTTPLTSSSPEIITIAAT